VPDLRIVFAGSPKFAAIVLETLAQSKYLPVAVYTQPDRPAGRGRKIKSSPVKELATQLDIQVMQPHTLRTDEAAQELAALEPDVMVVAAYGLILPLSILETPTYGCINVHASVLPRWRGAAPIERAIMAGDESTGTSIMQMEEGLDTGPVYTTTQTPIDDTSSGDTMEIALAEQGAGALLGVLEGFNEAANGTKPAPEAIPQRDNLASYASKLTREDRTIDWDRPAFYIARQINALSQRLSVQTAINGTDLQLIGAKPAEQYPTKQGKPPSGTVVDVTKVGITVQCATDLLQITAVRVMRGKSSILTPAAAINGFQDLFYVGAHLA